MAKRHKIGKDFSKLFPEASPEAIDLLKKLLMFDPEKRINVVDALAHPYLAEFHMLEDEPSRESVDYLDFEFEDHNLTTQQLKGKLQIIKMFSMRKLCSITIKSFTLITKERKPIEKALLVIFSRIQTLPTSILSPIPMNDS